jgi:hypothetical protein
MANTGNTQQQINYGAAANDGQGDPLRTAFIKTDDNFDAIWNAGPVGSNITIVNNTIQSNNTNGNIVLKPNGVGMIQANAAVLPNVTNVRDLGTANLRWRSAAIGTGGLTVDGNVTVTGNLSAGNISYTGNVFVGDLQGSVYADDSTIMVDAIDNAMFADSATFGQANVLGNISANYFVGNGSQLTGIASTYGNANVAAYLATYTGNISAGNINIGTGTLSYNSGLDAISITDGLEIVGTGSNYWRFNDSTDTLAFPSGASWSSDPATGDDYINSAQDGYLTFTTYDASLNEAVLLKLYHGFAQISVENGVNLDWTFDDTGNLTVAGDILPSANNVGNLGASDRQWNSLWVANNTIYIGGVPLGVTGNVLTVNGEPVLSNDSTANVSTTGNISAGNMQATGNMDANNLVVTNFADIGDISIAGGYITLVDGSASTGIDISPNPEGQAFLQVPNDATANTANLRVVNNAGNVRIETNAGTIWTFGYDGDLTAPGNVSANAILTDNYFYANGEPFVSSSTGNITFTNTTMSPPDGEDLFITAANSEVEITGLDFRVEVTDDVRIQGNDIVSIRNTSNNEAITIRTDYNGNDYSWEFDATGNLTAPGSITVSGDITVAGDITGTSSASTLVLAAEPDSNTAIQLNDTVDSIIRTVANLEIRTDSSNTDQTWTFDTTGNLVFPDDSIQTTAYTGLGNLDISGTVIEFADGATEELITVSPDGFAGQAVLQLPNNATANVYDTILTNSGGNVKISTGNGVAVYDWLFGSDGVLTAPGNISGTNFIVSESLIGSDASPQPTISGFSTISATGNITGGNLITAGNVVGNVSGFAIGYRDIPQVAFTGNATIATTDAGKHFYSTESTDYILTIADNSAVSWPVGTAITVVNRGTGNITVAQAAGVSLYLAGNSTAGNRVVTTYGMVTVLNVAANVWMINGTGVS